MEQHENNLRIQSFIYQYYFDGSYFSSGGSKIPAGAQDSPGVFFYGMDDRTGQASSASVRHDSGGTSGGPGQGQWMDPRHSDEPVFTDLGGGSCDIRYFFCGAVCDVGKDSQRGTAHPESAGYRRRNVYFHGNPGLCF